MITDKFLNGQEGELKDLILQIDSWTDRDVFCEVVESIADDINQYNDFSFGVYELFELYIDTNSLTRGKALRTLEKLSYEVSDQETVTEVKNVFDLARVQWYAFKSEYWGLIYEAVKLFYKK